MRTRPATADDGCQPIARRTPRRQIVLAFDDNRLASALFGQYGQNLALIERRLGVVAEPRGNHVTLEGPREACEQARRVLEGLYERLKRGDDWRRATSKARSGMAIAQGSLFDYDPRRARAELRGDQPAQAPGARAHRRRRTPISARSSATSWCSAPARPAPARPGSRSPMRSQLFERKEVDRIILSRPAVEAGERLGFLPGDMREKVDPYLRPIYDALYDLMDARIVERALQTGEIEIAPLAFMRGRTLVERRGHSRRGAEHHLDADEDVPHPARREQPHDRHRRSEPGRPAAGPDLRPGRGGAAARRRRGHRPCHVHRRRRDPPRTGRAHRRGLRQGRGGQARAAGMTPAARKPRRRAAQIDMLRRVRALAAKRRCRGRSRRGGDGPPRRRPQRGAELAIVLTDDSAIRMLNRDWRGMDEPTNVLSFPAPPRRRTGAACSSATSSSPTRRCARGRAERKPFAHHLAHLAVHGFLHLFGYDHVRGRRRRWSGRNATFCGGLGFPIPTGARARRKAAA